MRIVLLTAALVAFLVGIGWARQNNLYVSTTGTDQGGGTPAPTP
jgi:hypothetical protein